MSTAAKKAYDKHLENLLVSQSMIETAKLEGMEKGIERGIEKGKLEGITVAILNAHEIGLSLSKIASIVSISEDEVLEILRQHGKV